MKIGNQVKFKSSVVKRCGSDKNMADLRGEVVGVFGKTVDVKFQDRTRAVPVAITGRWRRGDHARADGLSTVRDRLAKSAGNLAPDAGRLGFDL